MTINEKIVEVIETKIRHALESHGGGIEFMGFDSSAGVLTVQLTGACGGCPHAQETLRSQVEAVLQREIPEVKEVVRTEY